MRHYNPLSIEWISPFDKCSHLVDTIPGIVSKLVPDEEPLHNPVEASCDTTFESLVDCCFYPEEADSAQCV